MSVIVKKLTIENLFERKNIEWDLKEVNVLVGKNGSGKTTILQTIYGLLQQEANMEMGRSTRCEITLQNEGSITHKINKLNIETAEMLEILQKMQKSVIDRKKKPKNYQQIKSLIDMLSSAETSKNIKEVNFGQMNVSENLKETKKVNAELISTVNMSANSIYEFKKSDGVTTTILDMEIEAEIRRLKSIFDNDMDTCKKIHEKIEIVINDLFKETGKTIKFENKQMHIIQEGNENPISYSILSSGERQLLYILLKAANTSCEETVLLMDEPEISLHLTWQEKLIKSIKTINESCQLIIVTHSPAIIMKGWLNAYTDIKSIEKEF